ncbi:MAG TPA: DUF2336 domain-containing protein [Allosphingosinicella sp.]|jgi:hypothetical protein|nr:DUF2336 domain-containing protein [Allosphingosinicella sp.]
MSEVRANGGELDGAAQLLASARARVSAAIADLALPEAFRLSDRQRFTVSHLLRRLVGDVEDELRSALAAHFTGEGDSALRAALSSASLPIALPVIEESGALADPGLFAILLRRAEEHRLVRSAAEQGLLTELAGDEEPDVAAAAVSLLIAASRRLDAFHEPLLASGDLPAEIAHDLAWTVAAALRNYLVARHSIPPAAADGAVTTAAAALLGRYDEGEGADALARRLALRLEERRRLDDALLVRAAGEGALPLLLAGLSLRTGLDPQALWELLPDSSGRGPAIVLRAAQLEREAAASILLHLSGREEAVAGRLDVYDSLGPVEARHHILLWSLDPAYRSAVARLAS